ncbi:MAG: DEAD/DEAH box helicase [Erysipelotrichaceae bacterium]|nr:DEAD/DEAH box helicase [Erysipelotrichaceae bacterium]
MKKFIEELIEYKNFKELTPIQKEVIPLAMENKNVIALSATGSGKTHAFLIPIMEQIDFTNKKLQAIIMSPTRELATQIYNMAIEFTKFNKDINIKLLVGGIERKKDDTNTSFQIIIGTPGRVKDYCVSNAKVNINTVKTIVLDEIDMIFELNFMEDIDEIVSRIKKVQILAFSATLSKDMKPFIAKYLTNAKTVQINEKTSSNVSFYSINTKHKEKEEVVLELTKCINPYVCLIFASKKKDVEKIYDKLNSQGLSIGMLHGDLESRERKQIYKRILNEEFTYVVCSDIASRGLDINSVTHVINVDFPKEKEYFFHRAGRTGRMNQTGSCYVLYNEEEKKFIKDLKENSGLNLNEVVIKGTNINPAKIRERKVSKSDEVLNQEIKKTVNKTKTKKVKPNYKKKVKEAVAKVKSKHKRQIIKDDIKKRQQERAKERTKAMKNGY